MIEILNTIAMAIGYTALGIGGIVALLYLIVEIDVNYRDHK